MLKVIDNTDIFQDLFRCFDKVFQKKIELPTDQVDICIDYWFDLRQSQLPAKCPGTLFIAISQEESIVQYEYLPNVLHVVACVSEAIKYKSNPDVVYLPTWFLTTVIANKDLANPPTVSKKSKYLADFLLGGQTPNRVNTLRFLKENNLVDRCLVNLRSRQHRWGKDGSDTPDLPEDEVYTSSKIPGLDPAGFENCYNANGDIFTMRPLTTERSIFYSHLIPWKIYENTMLSFVSETETFSDSVFFTEKTVKPLLAQRLCIFSSGQNALESLRQHGFRTFSPWIDESYDKIEHKKLRQNATLQSFLEFANRSDCERSKILSEIQPILEHNKNVMLDTNKWLEPLIKKIEQWFRTSKFY
jgi:hypothetical protein